MIEKNAIKSLVNIEDILSEKGLNGASVRLIGIPRGIVPMSFPRVPEIVRQYSHFLGYYGVLEQDDKSIPFHRSFGAGFLETDLIELARLSAASQSGKHIVLDGILRSPYKNSIEDVPYVVDIEEIHFGH